MINFQDLEVFFTILGKTLSYGVLKNHQKIAKISVLEMIWFTYFYHESPEEIIEMLAKV